MLGSGWHRFVRPHLACLLFFVVSCFEVLGFAVPPASGGWWCCCCCCAAGVGRPHPRRGCGVVFDDRCCVGCSAGVCCVFALLCFVLFFFGPPGHRQRKVVRSRKIKKSEWKRHMKAEGGELLGGWLGRVWLPNAVGS